MLTRERSADNDALHRLRHIQPGATNGRIEGHHPMIEEPAYQIIREMSSQMIEDQHETQRRFWIAWWMPQPGLPACAGRALLFRRQFCSWVCFLDLGQYFGELLFEPGMEHHIGSREHALGTQFSGGRSKECQQFGGATTLVLMWLCSGVAFRLPRSARLWDGLIRS